MPARKLKPLILVAVAAGAVMPLAGCSTNDNPINPDKMNQIRQQESHDRANFKPGMPTSSGK